MKLGRNLDYSAETALADLSPAALDDLLERGDLNDWAPLAAAVRADPHGALADMVLHLIDANPKYGTSPLWRHWIGRLRRRSKPDALKNPAKVGIGLGAIRRAQGLSQQEVGRRLGITQSDVSKLERRRDLRLSTLQSYIAATGGRLEITATHDGARTSIQPFEIGGIDPRTRTQERLLRACGFGLVAAPQVDHGVDRTQIRRILDLSPEQRLDQAAAAAVNVRSFLAEVKKSAG